MPFLRAGFHDNKKEILIIGLVLLLAGALLAYRAFHSPSTASARQHEEAAKLAQLKADLMKAASGGSGQTASSAGTSRRNTGGTSKPRPT